jgi:hypothetical protein
MASASNADSINTLPRTLRGHVDFRTCAAAFARDSAIRIDTRDSQSRVRGHHAIAQKANIVDSDPRTCYHSRYDLYEREEVVVSFPV